MTRYTPDADRMAIRRIRRIEAKATPKSRSSAKFAAIAESMGA
jgi:hypothetical protein